MSLDTLTALLGLLGAVLATLSGVGGLMAWGAAAHRRRFEIVDKRFENVDKRFENVASVSRTWVRRFEDVKADIADVRRELGVVKADIGVLRSPSPAWKARFRASSSGTDPANAARARRSRAARARPLPGIRTPDRIRRLPGLSRIGR